MECPSCKGSGKTGLVHINYGGVRPGEWREGLPCRRCQGEGEVSDKQADWIRRGEAIRRARVGRGESVRDVSRRTGLGSANISAMERGRADPARLENVSQ